MNNADAGNELLLRDTSGPGALGQHPYRAPSVFNFYRPGYIAPGTHTGALGLTAPELQITTASSVVGYPNFITVFALDRSPKVDRGVTDTFSADYAAQAELATDTDALLDNLDLLLTHGGLQPGTRQRIGDILEELGTATEQQLELRARVASILVMTSPEYLVLQ